MNAASRASAEACAPATALPEMVDISFGIAGRSLPRDFEWPLYREIARIIPWIAGLQWAGVLPIKGPRTADGGIMITHRARLVMRLPRERLCSSSALEHATIRVGESELAVGTGTFRKHLPSPTLYSPRVTAGEADEVRFVALLEEELAALGVRGRIICGRRVTVELEEGEAAAWPVAVHGLREADSLRLQSAGLGRGQAVGCGLLVPHKTITAAD
jgi:CRISPR-associated protein Cas6